MKVTGKRVMFLLLLVLAWGLPALAAEHPVPLPKDVQDKDCLECHDDKTKGKAVHSAMQMGCSACHNVKSDGTTTTVELAAPKNQLCFTCHDKSKEEVLHKPYEDGQCTTCHSPHSSDFAKQTRADGNALCLACHAPRQVKGDKVELFASQEISAQEFNEAPKVLPSDKAIAGHPWAGHPVAAIADPLNPAQKMSCLSCHNQHASSQQYLIRTAKDAKTGKDADICNTCHQAYEAQQKAANLKKYGAIEEQNRKAMEDKQRRQVQEQPKTPQGGANNQ